MHRPAYPTLAKAILATGALLLPVSSPQAEDVAFCVTCKGPKQTYLCKITGDNLRRNDALKLYCIVRTAKEEGHSSCAARNEIAGCGGAEKIYAYGGLTIPDSLAEDRRVQKLMKRVEREQKAFEKKEGKGPQTLMEATGRAVNASRRGIRNMRASLGGDEPEPQAEVVPQSAALPSAPLPEDRLPELPDGPSPQLPLSAAEEPEEPEEERKGRIRRGVETVGEFTRNSYRCMRSLFRNCGGD